MRPIGEVLQRLIAKAPERFEDEESYGCLLCRDREWVVEADGAAGKARPCSCVTSRSIEERLELMGVDRKLLDATWDRGYEPRPDLASFPLTDTCLTFMGNVGTGKSFYLVAILRQWLEAGKRCKFLHADALVRQARECFARDEQPDGLIDRLLRFDLVALDEAYGDRQTEFADDITSLLIRRCLRARTPLIITTNLTEEQLMRIEPKVASRVTGRGAVAFDFSKRPDYRRAE